MIKKIESKNILVEKSIDLIEQFLNDIDKIIEELYNERKTNKI